MLFYLRTPENFMVFGFIFNEVVFFFTRHVFQLLIFPSLCVGNGKFVINTSQKEIPDFNRFKNNFFFYFCLNKKNIRFQFGGSIFFYDALSTRQCS